LVLVEPKLREDVEVGLDTRDGHGERANGHVSALVL
jgi:hypothetical protein